MSEKMSSGAGLLGVSGWLGNRHRPERPGPRLLYEREAATAMCRYAWHNYRDHFACFGCRKAFKYWQWEDCEEGAWKAKARLHHVPREIVCPECDRPMVDMGLDFKAPPNSDREAWEILETLYENGFTFHGCGCGVGFKPPRTLREVPAWLEEHRKSSEGESLLKKFSARGG